MDENGETKVLDARYQITHAAAGVLDNDGNVKISSDGVPNANTVRKENAGYKEDWHIEPISIKKY